jgi:hypothetical protein
MHLSNKGPLRLFWKGKVLPTQGKTLSTHTHTHTHTHTFLSSHAVRTLLRSSFFINGLLMFMNVSVNELVFTMWFATTTPGKASCKTKLNYYSLKNNCLLLFVSPPPFIPYRIHTSPRNICYYILLRNASVNSNT